IPVAINNSNTNYYTGSSSVNNIEIDSNLIEGGYFAICSYGSSYTNSDWKFRGNTITNFYYYGVYIYYTTNFQANYNKVTQRNVTTTTGGTGIYASQINNGGGSEVIGNEVLRAYQYSIYLVGAYNPGGRGKIYNNIAGNGMTNVNAMGIYLSSATGWDIWHNTVAMNVLTTNANSACLYLNGSSSTDIRNNIFSVEVVGSSAFCIFTSDPAQQLAINYNQYFKRGGDVNTAVLNYNNNQLYSAATMRGVAGHNTNFFYEEPLYISTTNRRLSSIAASPFGDASLGVATDIDGAARCALFPTVGASRSQFIGASNVDIIVPDTVYVNSPVSILNSASLGEPKAHSW